MEDIKLYSNSAEAIVIGSLYKKPELLITYKKHINSKYDFYGEGNRFFYDSLLMIYNDYGSNFNENNVNAYMVEDDDRLAMYRKYGMYNTIKKYMDLSDTDNFKNVHDNLKKYTALRLYYNTGFQEAVKDVVENKKFAMLKSNDIIKIMQGKANSVQSVVVCEKDSIVLTEDAINTTKSYLVAPQIGISSPWKIINACFNGIQTSRLYLLGFNSNEGKSRNMTLLMAHLAIIHKKKVLIMSNEMTEEKFFKCLMTTVINNPQFQKMHGIKMNKPEKEYVHGIYRDDEGEIIRRLKDEQGNIIEDDEDFEQRVRENSQEYRNILKIAEWLESQKKLIYFKYISDYSDENLEFEIKNHNSRYGVKYFSYETLKENNGGDYSDVIRTTRKLNSLCSELDVSMWAVCQLRPDARNVDVFDLNDTHIASAKGIYTECDFMLVGKALLKSDYNKYEYMSFRDMGEKHSKSLEKHKTYFAMNSIKNRDGEKPVILFEFNLNYNTWIEVGELIKRKPPERKKK